MRKITIILFAMFSMLLINNVEEMKANEPDISWVSNLLVAGQYGLVGTLDFAPDLDTITIEIPTSDFHRVNTVLVDASIQFFDENLDAVIDIDWADSFGNEIGTFIDISLSCLDIVGAVHMTIVIPQSYSPTPAGYVTFIDDNDNVDLYFDTPDYRQTYFAFDRSGSPTVQTLTSQHLAVPFNTTYINLDLTDIEYLPITAAGFQSNIILKDADDIELDVLLFTDYISTNVDRVDFVIPDDQGYDLDEVAFFHVVLYVNDHASYDFVDNANRSLLVFFNNEAFTVNWYNDGALFSTAPVILGTIPTRPDDPVGVFPFIFQYWINADGSLYEFTAIDEDQVSGSAVSFYAFYLTTGDNIPFPLIQGQIDDSHLSVKFLNGLGFNDPISRSIVFAFVILAASGAMLFKRVNFFAILVVDLLITFFFMVLNLIPLFVSALVLLIFILLGFSFLGGGNNE